MHKSDEYALGCLPHQLSVLVQHHNSLLSHF